MANQFSRRQWLKGIGASLAGAAAFSSLLPETVFAQEREGGGHRGEIGRIGREFMQKYHVPGMSVAISKNGRFVYEHQWGMADQQHSQQVQPSSLFRIASVTKPITSVTIFSLIEQGKLTMHDKVFGPSGILGTKYGKPPYKQYVADVTVDHLLTHTAGGWPDDGTDPMFRNQGWDHEKLITWAIKDIPLTYAPGEHWAYSNFGYCVLGRVIEQVTGQSYSNYVQNNILNRCGISDMRIGGNKERDRAPNEVVYKGQFGENPNSMNVTRMDSHGGWIATPGDLVRFLNGITGAADSPGLLNRGSIRTMTTPAPASSQSSEVRYARGWNVRDNGMGNWWHNGSLYGTTSIMVRTSTGMCWAALINTRTEPSDEISSALDQMVWNMVGQVPAWGA